MRIARGKAGFTLMEMVVSLGALMLVVFGMTSVLVHSGRASDRTQSQVQVDSDVAVVVERIQSELKEARTVSIDSDGLGVTYKYPTVDGSGDYTISPTATDSTSNRLYVSDGVLYCSRSPDRPIITHIPTVDPETGTALRVFSSGLNSREIKVRLVSERPVARGCDQYSAVTTSIRPRNMP